MEWKLHQSFDEVRRDSRGLFGSSKVPGAIRPEPQPSAKLAVVAGGVLRPQLLHPADAAADVSRYPGHAQPGQPADVEPMASPLHPRVDNRVEPER
jgi:hypothetical protein